MHLVEWQSLPPHRRRVQRHPHAGIRKPFVPAAVIPGATALGGGLLMPQPVHQLPQPLHLGLGHPMRRKALPPRHLGRGLGLRDASSRQLCLARHCRLPLRRLAPQPLHLGARGVQLAHRLGKPNLHRLRPPQQLRLRLRRTENRYGVRARPSGVARTAAGARGVGGGGGGAVGVGLVRPGCRGSARAPGIALLTSGSGGGWEGRCRRCAPLRGLRLRLRGDEPECIRCAVPVRRRRARQRGRPVVVGGRHCRLDFCGARGRCSGVDRLHVRGSALLLSAVKPSPLPLTAGGDLSSRQ